MYIKELREKYPLLFEELLKHSRYDRKYLIAGELYETVNSALVWDQTPQGHHFWARVNARNYSAIEGFKEKYPKLFYIETMEGVEIINNGLFKKVN